MPEHLQAVLELPVAVVSQVEAEKTWTQIGTMVDEREEHLFLTGGNVFHVQC